MKEQESSLAVSTHEDVLHHRPEQSHSRTVVIALDASENSKFAFNWSLKNLIDKQNDELVIVNTRPIPYAPAPPMAGHAILHSVPHATSTEWMQKVEEHLKATSHKLLKEYGTLAFNENISCRAIALRGDPREEIVNIAKNVNADLLVVGSRGMGAIKSQTISQPTPTQSLEAISSGTPQTPTLANLEQAQSQTPEKQELSIPQQIEQAIHEEVIEKRHEEPKRIVVIALDESNYLVRIETQAKTESHLLLKKFGTKVLDTNCPCRAIALRGDPREEIVTKAKELNADLLVIGSRGSCLGLLVIIAFTIVIARC
ncbi:hypothetical protein HK098_000684 [Nowakowskiella sp. JEL0407]|nr:hypothetical protein HK098_000684 [Nowakowskiella sp. JEL0407]